MGKRRLHPVDARSQGCAKRARIDTDGETCCGIDVLPIELVVAILAFCRTDTIVRARRASAVLATAGSVVLRDRIRRTGRTREFTSAFFEDDAWTLADLLAAGHLPDGDLLVATNEAHGAASIVRIYTGNAHSTRVFFVCRRIVEVAVRVGAADVLDMCAGTSAGHGHGRTVLLSLVGDAVDESERTGVAYPAGRIIERVLAMTPGASAIDRLMSRSIGMQRAPLVLLVQAAFAAASTDLCASDGTWSRREIDAVLEPLGITGWHAKRLIQRACTALDKKGRRHALERMVDAMDRTHLCRGICALIAAGMGSDVREGVLRSSTMRERFYRALSEGSTERIAADDERLPRYMACSGLVMATMAFCDRIVPPRPLRPRWLSGPLWCAFGIAAAATAATAASGATLFCRWPFT